MQSGEAAWLAGFLLAIFAGQTFASSPSSSPASETVQVSPSTASAPATSPTTTSAPATTTPPAPSSSPSSIPASQTAETGPAIPPDQVEQLHQALRLLQAGRYAEADQIATILATRVDHPMSRAWLIAAQARQNQKRWSDAALAYKAFLSSSDTPAGREYVNRQLRLCQAATEPAAEIASPGSLLSESEKQAMAEVEKDTTAETTDHFTVTARNPKLAKLVAQEAESALKRTCGHVLGGEEYPRRIDIHVWADRTDYLDHSPGAENWSGGTFSISRVKGQVKRRIDLAQLDEKKAFSITMLDRTLPHELCHLVVAELFGDAPCPLYLNEGLAMLAETEVDNDRLLLAGTALAGKGRISLADILTTESGRLKNPDLFYAETYSLLLYLRQRLNDKQFAAFIDNVKAGSPMGEAVQRALHSPEDPDFLKTLETAWQRHAVDHAQYIRALRGDDSP